MKNKAVLHRIASVLLAIAMLVSVFSVSAADINGYYKTIASLDFEDANPISSKQDKKLLAQMEAEDLESLNSQ